MVFRDKIYEGCEIGNGKSIHTTKSMAMFVLISSSETLDDVVFLIQKEKIL